MKKIFLMFLSAMTAVFMTSCVRISSAEKFYSYNEKENNYGKITISVECSEVLDNMSMLNEGLEDFIPKDGIIVKKSKQNFESGDTSYDVLIKALKKEKIHMESKGLFGKKEIEGINYLYNTSCGKSSRWIYKINGKIQSSVSSEYEVKNGDKIEWIYVCNSKNTSEES